jgi:hypothetical protein
VKEPEARVTDQESVRTLGATIYDALREGTGIVISQDLSERTARACAALGLDPDAPLDGPLVVLHPGEFVGRYIKVDPERDQVYEWRAHVVVASGPEVGA